MNFFGFAHSLFEQIVKYRMWRGRRWRGRRLRRRWSCVIILSFSSSFSYLLFWRRVGGSIVNVSGNGGLLLLLPLSLVGQNRSPNHSYLLLHGTLSTFMLRPNPHWRRRRCRTWRRRRRRRWWRRSNLLELLSLINNNTVSVGYFLLVISTSNGLIRPSRILMTQRKRRWRWRRRRLGRRRRRRRAKYESVHRNLLNYIRVLTGAALARNWRRSTMISSVVDFEVIEEAKLRLAVISRFP